MKLILLISLLLRIDHNTPTIDTFDILELNHTYNEWGGERLVQIMGVDWHRSDRDFHVEWYKVLRDCHIKTEEGEKKWLKERREIADKIKDWMTRLDFLNSTEYKGEFNKMHKYYPKKNWRSGYWEIKLDGRIIRAKSFQETHTTNDREVEDRKEHPTSIRRGLSKTKAEIEREERERRERAEFADETVDFIGPLLKNIR
jgi:hypothetical protein